MIAPLLKDMVAHLEVMLPPCRCGSNVLSTKKWAKFLSRGIPMAQDKDGHTNYRLPPTQACSPFPIDHQSYKSSAHNCNLGIKNGT